MTNGTSTKQRALITGASAGIGEGFARHLARRGYDLVLVARRKERLDALAAELATASSEVIEADLAAGDGVSIIEQRLHDGDIDLLVNNAGFGTFGEFSRLPLDRELEELDLNVRALMRLSHAALGPMIERKRGGIINVASMAAYQPIPYNATYSATKVFVLHFSEGLHEEAKRYGVTVTCVCPGPVRTEFQQVAGVDTERIPALAWTSVDTVVETALATWRNGHAVATPGTFNMLTGAGARMTPHFITRRIAGAMFRDRAGL